MTARPNPCSILIAAISAALCVVAGSHRAVAQQPDAEAQFKAGVALMQQNRYAQACDAFESSKRVDPSAGTLLWLGDCRVQLGQLGSAWAAYQDALARVKNPRKREQAMARIAALEPRLSYLTVVVPADHRVDGLSVTRNGATLDPAAWDHDVPIDGGDYVIAGRAPGHDDWQTTVQVASEGAHVRVEVPALGELQHAPPADTPVTVLVAPPVASPPLAVAPPEAHPGLITTRRAVAIGVAGVAVIGAAVGIVAGVAARDNQHDAVSLCPVESACVPAAHATSLIATAHHEALAANLAFGGAALAAIGAGILWFTGAPDVETSRRVSVAPRVTPDQAGVVVMGRF